MFKCPVCEGKKGWREDMGEGTVLYEGCNYCGETGHIGLFKGVGYWLFQFEFVIDVCEWLDRNLTTRAADLGYCVCETRGFVEVGLLVRRCINCNRPIR